jgi:hypothetical protein
MGDRSVEGGGGPSVRPTMTGGALGSIGLLFWCGAMALAVAVPAPVYLRAPLVVSFAAVAPGWALVRHLRLSSLVMEMTGALALSTSLLTLGSYLMVVTGSWAPYVLLESLTLLVALDVAAVLLASTFGRGRRRDSPIPA